MDKNIVIGTFQWDLSKIESQIVENRKQIEQFSASLQLNKKALSEERKELMELGISASLVKKEQEKLEKEYKKGAVSKGEYNKKIKEVSDTLKEIEKSTMELSASQSQHIKTIIDQENAIKSLKRENAELTKIHEGQTTNVRENLTPYKELQKELEEMKIQAKNMGAQLVQLRREGKENTQEYKNLEEQWEKVSKQADDLNNDFKALDKAVGDNQRNVGDYKDAIVGASSEITESFQNILNGNITEGVQQLAGSFGALRTAFMSLTTSMLSNPITAILVGISAVATGVGLAVKEMFHYSDEVARMGEEVERLTNKTGEVADKIRINAKAISNSYGKEVSESIKEMYSLMEDFGISAEEAFDIYNKGLADGGAINDEFGESIREYGVLMAQNGFTAQEFVDILNAGIDLDIYSDKLPDAIKEAGLSLTEQTTATRDALINAFGEYFTNDILQRVKTGKISVAEALNEISAKAKTANLNLQQQAQLTADVFRGAGEDAGGSLKIFEAINRAHEKNKAELTELQKHTIELTKLEKELAEAKDKALKSESIIAFKKNLELFWVKAQAIWYGFVEWISKAIPYVDKITGASEVLGETWNVVTDYAKAWWEAVSSLVDIFSDLFTIFQINNNETKSYVKEVFKLFNPLTRVKVLFKALTSVINGISKALQSARVTLSTFAITISNVVPKIIDILSSLKNLEFKSALEKINNLSISKEIAKANAEAKKLIKTSKTAEEEKEKTKKPKEKAPEEEGSGGGNGGEGGYEKTENGKKKSKAKDDAKKKAEEEARKAIELQKEKTQQSIELAKIELAEYIRLNAEKYKDEKRWTAERLKDQIDYYNEVKRQQLAILKQEQDAKEESIRIRLKELEEKKSLSANELQEKENLTTQLVIIDKQYAEERTKIEADTREKIKDDEETFETQQYEDKKNARAVEFQQRLIDLEIQGDEEHKIKRLQAQQQYEEDLADLEEKRAEELISLENYEAQKKAIEDQYAQARKDIDKEVEMAKIEGFANVFSQMKNIFGEQTALSKASAIAETTISTYKSAVDAYANAIRIPIIGIKLAPIMAGLAVASGLKSVQKIMSVQTPKAQRGMLIKGNSHAQGGVPILTPNGMIEAEGGEIIINKVSSYLFKDLLSEINVAGGGVKFAKGGVVGSQIPSVQRALKPLSQNITINDEAVNKIANAIYKGSQSGISDLSDNNRIMRGANF